MNIIDANYNFDKSQLLFHFLADTRVDFRELAKKLAGSYRTRIELRQIGVRDKAKMVGGLGPCGRILCCNSFLNDFNSVSINMAKNQMLALNPTKINGVCGRLLCCLGYEDDVYTELKKGMPSMGSIYRNGDIEGKVVSLNLLKKTATIETKSKTLIEVDV
jgi:cell fate regulator YaaT (PSP1 superfamily)